MSRHEINEFDFDHKLAKLIVAILVCGLLIAARYYGFFIFDILAVFIWIFGVNFIAHALERIEHHKTKHPWL